MANPFEDLDKPDLTPSRQARGGQHSRKGKHHKGALLVSLGTLILIATIVLPLAVMWLRMVSFFILPLIAAPLTWLMAHSDLKQMDAGRIDRAGRPQTQTARRLAMLSTLFCSLYLMGWLGFQFFTGGDLISAVGSRRITKEEFKRVQLDMTKKRVTEILGQPARTAVTDGRLNWYWYEKNGRATFNVEFDDRGCVRECGWDDPD